MTSHFAAARYVRRVSWLLLSITSALLLGFYDFFKKAALRHNEVTPVLFGSVAASAAVWLPMVAWSKFSPDTLPSEFFHVTGLTPRELEAIHWVANGKTSSEIALILSLSEHTVNTYVNNAIRKLDCVNRTHLVAKALRLRLIT